MVRRTHSCGCRTVRQAALQYLVSVTAREWAQNERTDRLGCFGVQPATAWNDEAIANLFQQRSKQANCCNFCTLPVSPAV